AIDRVIPAGMVAPPFDPRDPSAKRQPRTWAIAPGTELPHFDVQAPLLSLPAILGTTLETIPSQVPYLSADPALVERWRRELDALPGFKVGIVWQGNPTQKNDRHRSTRLAHFAPLAELPGVHLVSLQVGPGTEQLR